MALLVKIKKRYGGFVLQVSLEAEKEFLALLGASGSGKSLTLKCIAGIETPDSGKIILNGKVLFDSERKINLPPQKRHVGYLFQQYALFETMTVIENVAVGVRGMRRRRKRDEVQSWIDRMELQGLEHRYPAQLSGGQKQRVALARIMAARPEVILLDEPFSAIDSYLQWKLELELRRSLEGFEGTVLWVSHEREEIARNCTRVCVLSQGQSEETASVRELLSVPKTVSAAKLMGCKTIVRMRREGKTAYVPEWKQSFFVPEGHGVCLGIPAERLTFAKPGMENAILCIVVYALHSAVGEILVLRPLEALSDAHTIRMDVRQRSGYGTGDLVTVAIAAEHVLLLQS